jgi:hypothetical protein
LAPHFANWKVVNITARRDTRVRFPKMDFSFTPGFSLGTSVTINLREPFQRFCTGSAVRYVNR